LAQLEYKSTYHLAKEEEEVGQHVVGERVVLCVLVMRQLSWQTFVSLPCLQLELAMTGKH